MIKERVLIVADVCR